MQFDQETIKELEQAFTASLGPGCYSITFPSSMESRRSQEECRAIVELTLKFAQRLLSTYDPPDLKKRGFKKTPWGWQAPAGKITRVLL